MDQRGHPMLRSRRRIAIVAIAVLMMVAGAIWDAPTQGQFLLLRILRNDNEWARPLATSLAKTKTGVRLAVRDMSIFGGKTGGWSSQILIDADSGLGVNEQLSVVMEASEESQSRRMKAADILWLRTRDTVYLRKLYELCRNAGPITVRRGRVSLMTYMDEPWMVKALDLPNTVDLPVEPDEFDRWLAEIADVDSNADGH